jgi:hypothetical protein
MSDPAQRIDAIRRFPAQLAQLVEGLTAEQLTTAYNAPEWTIAQNVHHVADSHMNSFIRFRLLITEDNPTIRGYNQEDWGKLVDSQDADISSSLAILRGLHQRWVQMLESITDWSRPGMHPESGPISLDSLLTTYANHGEGHLKQTREVMAKMPK